MSLTEELKMQIGRIGTMADCKEAWDLVKHRWNLFIRKQAEDFYVGQAVWFLSEKLSGKKIEGIIERINSKSITVKVGVELWKVSPTLLHGGTNG